MIAAARADLRGLAGLIVASARHRGAPCVGAAARGGLAPRPDHAGRIGHEQARVGQRRPGDRAQEDAASLATTMARPPLTGVP